MAGRAPPGLSWARRGATVRPVGTPAAGEMAGNASAVPAGRRPVRAPAGQQPAGPAPGAAAADLQRPVDAGPADRPVRPVHRYRRPAAAAGADPHPPALVLLWRGLRVPHSGPRRSPARLRRMAAVSTALRPPAVPVLRRAL